MTAHRARPRRGLSPFTVIGEVLLTVAAFFAGFLLWVVWGSDLQADARQGDLLESAGLGMIGPDVRVGPMLTDGVPVITGDGVYAALWVPRWGADYQVPIAQGTGLDVLNTAGIGHYTWTQEIGEVGNAGLAAHRTSYGSPFRGVDRLTPGDAVVVEGHDAWLVYEVVGHDIVRPWQVEVLDPVPPVDAAEEGDRYLTLTTCHPVFGTAERFIVWAEFAYWTPKAEGVPPALAGVVT